MKDYPYFRLYIANVMQETRRLSQEEKGDYLDKLIDSWVDSDYESMPAWLVSQVEKLGTISEARSNSAKKRWEVKIEQPKLLSAPTKEIKPKAEKTPIDTADFERFWVAYPKERRIDKQNALKAWIKADPDIDVVLSALEAQKANWTDSNFIPHPTTWINKKRWEMPTEIVKKEPEEEDRIKLWKISLGMPL